MEVELVNKVDVEKHCVVVVDGLLTCVLDGVLSRKRNIEEDDVIVVGPAVVL